MMEVERFGEVIIITKDGHERMYINLDQAMQLYAELSRELTAKGDNNDE